MRALPEHSVLEDSSATTSQPSKSGGTSSVGLDKATSFDRASESKSEQANNTSTDQSLPGIATVDFAHSTGSIEGIKSAGDGSSDGLFFASQGLSQTSNSSSGGGGSSEGLFFTSQGLSQASTSSSTSQQQSSSSYSATTSQQQSSSYSSTQQSSSSAGQQVQSGKMTFTLPDFGKDNQLESAAAQDDVLSPTQARDE